MNADQVTIDAYAAELTDRARDTGTANALWAAQEWAEAAQLVLDELISSDRDFTSDDVRLVLGPAPSPGAEGALILRAAKAGRIRAIGFERSKRPARHGGVLRVWEAVHPRE